MRSYYSPFAVLAWFSLALLGTCSSICRFATYYYEYVRRAMTYLRTCKYATYGLGSFCSSLQLHLYFSARHMAGACHRFQDITATCDSQAGQFPVWSPPLRRVAGPVAAASRSPLLLPAVLRRHLSVHVLTVDLLIIGG